MQGFRVLLFLLDFKKKEEYNSKKLFLFQEKGTNKK